MFQNGTYCLFLGKTDAFGIFGLFADIELRNGAEIPHNPRPYFARLAFGFGKYNVRHNQHPAAWNRQASRSASSADTSYPKAAAKATITAAKTGLLHNDFSTDFNFSISSSIKKAPEGATLNFPSRTVRLRLFVAASAPQRVSCLHKPSASAGQEQRHNPLYSAAAKA